MPQPIRPHVAPAVEDQSHRERFDAHELATVLSHYDLGVIEQLRVHPRGSRRSPKLRIKTRRGEFLLKRRASGQDDPYRVAFAHDLQLRLGQRGYPVPGLIGTRDENNSMLQFNGRAYEMFNYVHGIRFDRTAQSAVLAGAALGKLHSLLADYRSVYDPPVGSFHGAGEINAKMALIPAAVCAVEPQTDRAALAQTAEFLKKAYHDAARRVEDAGFGTWPRRVIHGDWHPGNLLYRDGPVVGVLDFDSARSEPRIVDVANAGLQFSMRMDAAENPSNWPDALDDQILRCIFHGYDQASGTILTNRERIAAPWLMIEALIAESVVPIAATGSFARIAGSAFLYMIERKVRWLRPRAAKLAEPLKE
ncbi:MAG: phosphotransferase [Phycisphaerales bacterium]|nr:phosphotransferase [Phycisphaerales bacterium]